MSELKVEVVEIEEVLPHGNADRLEIAKIKGWYCVVGKGQFQTGARGVYFPIDSILPPALEATLFPEGSKIKLTKSRVKTTKIRGVISQGLLISPSQVEMQHAPVGTDATEALGVKKYEPEEASIPNNMKPSAKRHTNPNFKEYSDIQNAKNYPRLFEEFETVIATEKIHGTNFRAGWVPYVPHGFWERLKTSVLRWISPSWIPKYEFVYGSRRVQLQKKTYNGFYVENVYTKMVKKYDLENKIRHGYVIYGEIYGGGIQKGYTYGLGENEHDMVIFDIMQDDVYIDVNAARSVCLLSDLPFVPVVYQGSFHWDHIRALTLGPSVLSPAQKVREGVVVRSVKEENSPYAGRKQLKFISDEYLLKDQSDFH